MKDLTVRLVVEIKVEDDWSRESYLGEGRKAIVANRMRSATTQAVTKATLPYMEVNGITVVGVSVSAPEWIESDQTDDDITPVEQSIVDEVLAEVIDEDVADAA